MRSLKSRLARSIFWIAWSRGALQLLSFATTILIAHILAPADYGVMAIATIWTTTIGMLAEMGLGTALIQFRDLEREEIDACFWLTMAAAILGYLLLAHAAGEIADWFGTPKLAEVLPIVGLVLPVTACSVVSDSLLRKRLELDRVSQAEIIGGVVTLPIMLGCAMAHMGIWTLVVGALVGPAVRSATTCAFAPWLPRLKVGGERFREVIHFSIATMGVKFLWVLREQADVFVLGKVAGDVTVGIYDMAKQLALLPSTRISSVVNMLSTPVMAELQDDVESMRTALYRATRLTASLALPTAAGVALVADELVDLLLGPKWTTVTPILTLLCVYAAVRSVDVLLPPVLLVRRRQKFLFWYTAVLLFAVPLSALIGALWYGPKGLVICSTPTYCIVMAFMARETLKEISGGFLELWRETWTVFLATAIMALVVETVRRLGLGSGTANFLDLLLLVLTGIVSYLVALIATRSPVIREGSQILGWVMGGHRAQIPDFPN
jgi:teichuronic acid exporter